MAVTRSGTTNTLYINGVAVASNTVALSPADLGNTTNNWIGRSQYADPLLAGFIDEFQIYDRSLDAAEVQSLTTSPGGTPGGGNVAWYRFDEADGSTVIDASGNGRDATVETVPEIVGDWPGKVFKHRLTSNGDRVQWKDQQNFLPFLEGLVPNEPEYTQALRYYADAAEYPIMPFYTSNQRDKQFAAALGIPGSNNFSNINSTLQAQLYARALRDYPTDYVTPDMYRSLLEWLTWVQYVGGDNRLPNNNEFFFGWNPETQTFGRSGILHNILGAYNFMLIDDIAGVRPRLDDRLELWPIDVGWERFAIADLPYHGHDLSLVWDRPGGADPYPNAPEGFSGYVDGTAHLHRRRPRPPRLELEERGRDDRRRQLDGRGLQGGRADRACRRDQPPRQRPRRSKCSRTPASTSRRPRAGRSTGPGASQSRPRSRRRAPRSAPRTRLRRGRLHDQRPAGQRTRRPGPGRLPRPEHDLGRLRHAARVR